MTQQEKTFIVQNVTQGPVCISDIGKKGLTIQALSIHDLRTNDPEEVQRSEGLSKALRLGLLREVSADYASKDEVKKTTAQRQDIIDKLKQDAVRARYDNEEQQLKKISKKGSKPVVKEPEFDEPLTEIDLTKDL